MVNELRFTTPLGSCIMGIAIFGCLGYRAVQWAIHKSHKLVIIDSVTQRAISSGDLSDALFEQAKLYIDAPANLRNLPRASSGRTPVYLPEKLPIVLKQSGSLKNQNRLDKMEQGRDLCENNGYKHLVIPKARVYRNFIIESRLPIPIHDTKEQIGFYKENRERFASAVEEFTGFLCQSSLADITGSGNNPYGTLSETPMGRYDNIALYLEAGQGKIGLVDLAEFTLGCSKDDYVSRCRDAVHLFPYHLDEILKAAKKFDPNIEAHRGYLEKERDGALKRFKLAYEDHLDFVDKKGISTENPLAFEKLGKVRTEQLQKVIEEELYREHTDAFYKGCLGALPDKTLISFNEKAFPQILDATYTLLNDLLESNQKIKGTISTRTQLLSIRTLKFGYPCSAFDKFVQTTSKSLNMLDFGDVFDRDRFSILLFDVILKELEKGGEIAYYNPRFGYGDYATRCVFC